MDLFKQLFRLKGQIVSSVLLLAAAALLLTAAGSVQTDLSIQLAPLNPEFVSYLEKRTEDRSSGEQLSTNEGHALGSIPSPFDRTHLKAPAQGYLLQGLPARYDLRETGRLTPIKDQGQCNCCWSFAVCASLESYLMPGEVWDFSENNLKNTHGFDRAHDHGGNCSIATAYLARWGGPVSEVDDPYNPDSGLSPAGPLPLQKQIPEVIYLPDRTAGENPVWLKQAIMEGGAVYTAMHWDDENSSSWNSDTHSYYYSGSEQYNHAVAVVGWDDGYSKSNFNVSPPHDGAFIVRNNWGAAWGEEGYFYLSYDDTIFARSENTLFHSARAPDFYSRNYQYDPLGQTGSLGYDNSPTCWGANIFEAVSGETLAAVGLYALDNDTAYTIIIRTGVSPDEPGSGAVALSDTGTISRAGYHTINLSSPVALTAGQRFSVIVELTTPGYSYPLPIERPIPDYASPLAQPGQSFYSHDGHSWQDLTTYLANTNACIKAFTVTPFYPGDIDGSGEVNVGDAILVLRGIVGLIELNPEQLEAADVSGSNGVDVSDAILILRYIVGLITEFPVER